MARSEHTGGIWALRFSADGRELYSGSVDGTVNVREARTGELVRTLSGHTRAVLDIDFTAEDRRVITASRDRSIKEWDRQTGELIDTRSGHDGGVFAVELAGASDEASITLYDVDTGAELWHSAGDNRGIISGAVTEDRKTRDHRPR